VNIVTLKRIAGHVFLFTAFAMMSLSVLAGTVTLQTSSPGPTPSLLAYNSGHFYPGSNTKEWWRYSGVSGARVFLTASILEATDDIAGHGDGVVDQNSFEARKALLRSDPNNTNYINWPYFTNRYNTTATHGANRLQPTYILTELRKLGVQIDVNIAASTNTFIITDASDWAGKWELWQHFYAQAFYLGRGFDVQRYQMYNEPDHPNAGPVPLPEYLMRLQLCSDAVQCALADVNTIYSKSLVPKVLAPVVTTSSYGTWAQYIVPQRHVNYLGQTNANYLVLHQYDYHQYNSTPAQFGASVASLRSSIATAMSPETPLPVSISEFNVHTAANFDAIADTLDYPTKYPRLGAIAVNLVQNGEAELYNFKLSQTDGDVGDNYPVRKNGMHYVDNDTSPYNIGGITKAGEVWRLFNKAFAPGRERRNSTTDGSLGNLSLLSSYDPATARYFVFSANDSTTASSVTLDVSAFNIPDNNRVLIEEVSENFYGSISHYTRVLSGQVTTFTQPTGSVWLVTIPVKPQQFVSPGVPTLTIVATNDATVKDGANKNVNYGAQTNLVVRNDPANTANRSAAFVKFRLPAVYLPDVQFAVLTVSGATLITNATGQAHVFGITNNSWSQSSVTWATAPNLSQNIPAGNRITNQFVSGLGDSAFLQGQLVFTSTSFTEQQIDVTTFIRSRTNYDASFLVSQDPRWNIALPSLAAGDSQPDGMQLISLEDSSTNGPRLLLVRLKDTDGDGLSDDAELNIFGTNPNDADTDHDGFSDGDEVLIAHTDPLNGVVTPPSISAQPVSQTVGVGDLVSFSVTASGTPPLAYQWRFNATNILAGATNSALSLSNIQQSQAGNYSVLVTNAGGPLTSSNALLTVTSAPPVVEVLPAYEPFVYTANSALVGQGGWLLNGGTSGTLEAGNLNVDGLLPAIGNRLTWGGPSMSLRLPLNTNVTSGAIYFSFALRIDDLGSSFTGVGTLAGFTTGTGTDFGTKINIRNNGPTAFNLGTSKAGGTTYGDWAAENFNVGATIFVVGCYIFNGGTGTDDLSALWLNPDTATFGLANPPLATIAGVGNGGADLAQIDRFFFRSGGSTASPAKLVTDELRIGFTWASVTAPVRPSLAVSRIGNSLTLSWPTNPPAFGLEETAALPAAGWSAVTNASSINGTNQTVTLQIAPAGNRFFRLRR